MSAASKTHPQNVVFAVDRLRARDLLSHLPPVIGVGEERFLYPFKAGLNHLLRQTVLPRIRPMRPRYIKEPFDNPDYIFELKHDGFRAVVYLQIGECKIISRNQRNLGFESLKKALTKLPRQSAIIDGEIVCLDAHGVSRLDQLLGRRGQPVLYAFDLLWLDGEDLRQTELLNVRSG